MLKPWGKPTHAFTLTDSIVTAKRDCVKYIRRFHEIFLAQKGMIVLPRPLVSRSLGLPLTMRDDKIVVNLARGVNRPIPDFFTDGGAYEQTALGDDA